MKPRTLLLVFTIVMAFFSQVACGGQARHSPQHLISNKNKTRRHANINRSRHANSRGIRRITSGIYSPPRRDHSLGYGEVYGSGTHVRSENLQRHSGYGYQPYYYPYYNSFYIYDDIPPVYEADRVIVHENQDVILGTTVNAANQDRLIGKVLRAITSQRLDSVRQLARYPNMASVAVLIDALINDAGAEVREAAAQSLGDIYDPVAYEALLRSERYDADGLVRNAANLAIEAIRYNNDPKTFSDHPVLVAMNDGRAKLGDYLEEIRFGRAEQREEAVCQLDQYQGTQAVAALIDTLINDPDEYVRNEAAYRLGNMGDRLAIPFLEAAANDDLEKRVQHAAWKALEKYPKIDETSALLEN